MSANARSRLPVCAPLSPFEQNCQASILASLFCSVIAVNVLVLWFRKPAPDFPNRDDHDIETTNLFFRESSEVAVPKLLEGVAFKREDPHQISLLDETVLLQYGALGFAWLSKSPSQFSLKRPLERDDIAWRLNHFSPERNSGASSVKNQDDWRKLSCMSACCALSAPFSGSKAALHTKARFCPWLHAQLGINPLSLKLS